MPIDQPRYRQALDDLDRAVRTLYGDLRIEVERVPGLLYEVGYHGAEEFARHIGPAWYEVEPTEEAVRVLLRGLSMTAIQDHGLYGAELGLKLGLWEAARRDRDRIIEARERDRRPGFFSPRRWLGGISKALGHADNWLESLIKAMGQHERLVEVKKAIEKAAGDVGE